MGIFSKIADIASSNINSILDKAQDPLKMSRLMIQEMEDTLVEVKSNIAQVLADQKRIQREMFERETKLKYYNEKADMSVERGREDLAKRILNEQLVIERELADLTAKHAGLETVIAGYREDLVKLETKLAEARKKSELLKEKTDAATTHRKVEESIYKVDTSSAFSKFERLEAQLDDIQAQGDVVNMGRELSIDEEIEALETSKKVEERLSQLKEKHADALNNAK